MSQSRDRHARAILPTLFSADETTDLGSDSATPVSDDYGSDSATPVSDDYGPRDSRFSGMVDWVQLDVDAAAEDIDHDITDAERIRMAMARQ